MRNMQEVMKLIDTRKSHLTGHSFFKWATNDQVPLNNRLLFAPIMTIFVMNFRDMNKWFIRFDDSIDPFKEIINGNTDEDETHSALFLEDWKKLDLDRRLSWKASDTLWWLFLAEETEPFRAYGFDFARMTIDDNGDPFIRFAHSEAGEACGNVFFATISLLAEEVTKETGLQYRYFGHYHLDREQGHVIASEGVFENQPLTEAQAQLAIKLAEGMFTIFDGMHNQFLNYSQKYVNNRLTPKRPQAVSRPALKLQAPDFSPKKPNVTPLNAEVQAALDARRLRAANHPFYAWLRADNDLSPLEKLQRFIPMWVVDIMGYRDINRYALRIQKPRTADELAFNRWIDTLETHSAIFLRDWDALGMDDALDWKAYETLDFLFLDPATDIHRRNIASFMKLALKYDKPILRFWLLEALEASGESFFKNTRRLALTVEAETGCCLDYLADRHDAGEDTQLGLWSYLFKGEPMEARDKEIALAMIDTVFNALEEQLTLSLEVASSNKFRIGSADKAQQQSISNDVSMSSTFAATGI